MAPPKQCSGTAEGGRQDLDCSDQTHFGSASSVTAELLARHSAHVALSGQDLGHCHGMRSCVPSTFSTADLVRQSHCRVAIQ